MEDRAPGRSRTGTGSQLLVEWEVASAPDPCVLAPALGQGSSLCCVQAGSVLTDDV